MLYTFSFAQAQPHGNGRCAAGGDGLAGEEGRRHLAPVDGREAVAGEVAGRSVGEQVGVGAAGGFGPGEGPVEKGGGDAGFARGGRDGQRTEKDGTGRVFAADDADDAVPVGDQETPEAGDDLHRRQAGGGQQGFDGRQVGRRGRTDGEVAAGRKADGGFLRPHEGADDRTVERGKLGRRHAGDDLGGGRAGQVVHSGDDDLDVFEACRGQFRFVFIVGKSPGDTARPGQ